MDSRRNNLGAQSLLVPAYGCETPDEAKEYLNHASSHQLDYSRPVVIRGERNLKFYVTIAGYWHDISTNALQVNQIQEEQEDINTLWVKFRKQCDFRPGYPVCLMAEGRLKYNCQIDSTGLPNRIRQLMNGQRDCYATWQREDGLLFCTVTTLNEQSGLIVIHAARSGRGAVYARTAILDRNGHLAGYLVVRVRLEFKVLCNDPNKDDVIKVKIGRTVTREGVDEDPRDSDIDDDQWKQLMARAQQGFFSSGCQCLPDEVESERRMVIEQVARFNEDAGMAQGQRFHDLVETISWQDALRMVSESWQLEVVRRFHLQSSVQQSSVQPPCRTLLDMILQHDCQEERREELIKLARALVDLQDCF